MHSPSVILRRWLTPQSYASVYQQMRNFTATRTDQTPDELWFLEHQPVFTQGPRSQPEHLLNVGNIPVVATNRGGQVTYHGPGQLIVYPLIDITKRQWNVRQLVAALQDSLLQFLQSMNIPAYLAEGQPGVYVQPNGAKIASLGLRIHKGCSYHGISLNIDLDLSPFSRICPCGVKDQKVTKMTDFVPVTTPQMTEQMMQMLPAALGYAHSALLPALEEITQC